MSAFTRLFVIGAAAAAGYAIVARPRLLRWGATATEVEGPLPGDDIVPGARMVSTRAIDISAPPSDVWPWIVQMGHGRGGLYSVDALENAAGLGFHSADTIHPEWQDLAVGDRIRLVPEGTQPDLAFEVKELEPERHLVLGPIGDAAAAFEAGMPYPSWAFVLRPTPLGSRLVVRFRSDYRPSPAGAVVNQYGLEPIHFLMEMAMLRGIRDRAERLARGEIEPEPAIEPLVAEVAPA
jgi:hypothetical protein